MKFPFGVTTRSVTQTDVTQTKQTHRRYVGQRWSSTMHQRTIETDSCSAFERESRECRLHE